MQQARIQPFPLIVMLVIIGLLPSVSVARERESKTDYNGIHLGHVCIHVYLYKVTELYVIIMVCNISIIDGSAEEASTCIGFYLLLFLNR